MPRLTGTEAITYAALTATQLASYTPPVAQPRDDITVPEAEAVTLNGGFVWSDTDRDSDEYVADLDVGKIQQQLAAAGHPQELAVIERVLATARERAK